MLQRLGRRFGQKGSTRYIGAPCASRACAGVFALGRAPSVTPSASKQIAAVTANSRRRLFRVLRFAFTGFPPHEAPNCWISAKRGRYKRRVAQSSAASFPEGGAID